MSGELIVRKGGYLGVEDSDREPSDDRGRFMAVEENIDDCCCCNPCESLDPKPYKSLGSWSSDYGYVAAHDTSKYKKKGGCFRHWIIVSGEVEWDDHGCFKRADTTHDSGSVEDGELIGLAEEWESSSAYQVTVTLYVLCCYA